MSRFNYISISKFHNSSILYSNKDDKTKTIEEKPEVDLKGLDNIPDDQKIDHDPEVLKERFDNLTVPDDYELPKEWLSVVDPFNIDMGKSSTPDESSTPDDSSTTSSDRLFEYGHSKFKIEDNDVKEELKNHTEAVVKSFKKALDECGKEGTIPKSECLNNIKLSELLTKHKSTPNEILDTSIKEEIKESIKTNMIDKLGDMKVSEVLAMGKSIKDKLYIGLKINPVDLAIQVFSYGVVLKSYDAFVNNVKIPPKKVDPIHLKTMKISAYYNGLFFASIMAPVIVLSLNHVKSNHSLIKEVNISPSSSTGRSNTDDINKNIFWGLFAKLNIKSWVKFFIFSIILILGLISFNFPDFSYSAFFSNFYKNLFVFYLKWLVLILGLIPITLNLMWMIILKLISKNKLPKILYHFKYLQVLKESKENKVVYSYYYNRSIREVIFYIGILSTYFLFIYLFI